MLPEWSEEAIVGNWNLLTLTLRRLTLFANLMSGMS
jgi:hypothetical protein